MSGSVRMRMAGTPSSAAYVARQRYNPRLASSIARADVERFGGGHAALGRLTGGLLGRDAAALGHRCVGQLHLTDEPDFTLAAANSLGKWRGDDSTVGVDRKHPDGKELTIDGVPLCPCQCGTAFPHVEPVVALTFDRLGALAEQYADQVLGTEPLAGLEGGLHRMRSIGGPTRPAGGVTQLSQIPHSSTSSWRRNPAIAWARQPDHSVYPCMASISLRSTCSSARSRAKSVGAPINVAALRVPISSSAPTYA